MVARAHKTATNVRSGGKAGIRSCDGKVNLRRASVEGTMNKRDKLILIDARIEGIWRRAKSKGLDRLDIDSLNGLYTLRDRVEKSGSQRVNLHTAQKRRRTPRTFGQRRGSS